MADDDKREGDTDSEPDSGSESGSESGSGSDSDSEATEEKKSGGMMVGLLGFLLALGVGFFIGQIINKQSDDVELEEGERFKVSLRGDEPQLGPDDALVTVVEFADYQCPYCAKANKPLKDAVASFGDDVRLIYKHFPLPSHTRATPAAKAAWAAHQQGKFWEMHDVLFENKANVDASISTAGELGLDVGKYKADLVSDAAATAVDEDLKAGATLGVRGTPAFFVNGHTYRGLRSEAQWKAIIENELDYAKQLVSSGTPRGQIYAALMKDAKTQGHLPSPPRPEVQPGGPDPAAVYKIPIAGRPALGPADALVTVAVFSDFQCPFCEKLQPVVHELVENNDDVRVVFVNLPLPMHARARDAAMAALAAHRQGKFWEMHDTLFEKRRELGSADFSAFAEELGLDVAQFEQDLQDPAIAKQVEEDEAVARTFGIRSTPSSFVNGRFVRGAQGTDVYQSLIDEERGKAKALVDAGTPRQDVYERLLANALTQVAEAK